MAVQEIREDQVDLLYECLAKLAEHHNEISVHFKGIYPLRDYQATLELFKNQLASGHSYIAVIKEQTICGFCKVDIEGACGKLDYLMVLAEYRGNGYGRILMDWAMQTFKNNQVQSVEVKVVDGNPAIHLYEKYGFLTSSHILRKDL